ncbi:MAG: hypothetical protein IPO41_18055 [Acidobacteria bacterium]|nr:hypothetical protein [Acidobacteriota bacterium]
MSSIACFFATASTCRQRTSDAATVALPEKFTTLDTLTTASSESSAERIKNLMFNTLVRKDENFDYVGELVKDITTSPDNLTITFTLRDNVKFHNGKALTSADVKYTFDELFKANGFKAKAFSTRCRLTRPTRQSQPKHRPRTRTRSQSRSEPKTKSVPHITSIATPDAKTVVFAVTRPALRNQFLSNLVAIPIIPEGSVGQQKRITRRIRAVQVRKL